MENLTFIGSAIALVSIIYNILTKLKNAKLTKDLLELEDLFSKAKVDNENLTLELKSAVDKNRALVNDALIRVKEDASKMISETPSKVSKAKKSK